MMGISSWTLYWITRLDVIQTIALVCLTVGFISGFGLALGTLVISYEDENYNVKKLIISCKYILAISVVSLFIYSLTPSSKEMAAILVIPQIAKSESIMKLTDTGSKLLDLTNAWIDSQVQKAKDDSTN